jgi:hypothetical protein
VIRPSGYIRTAIFLAVALAAAAVVSGCSSNAPPLIVPNPSAPLGLPTPPNAGPVNTYFGVQSPGTWTLAIDNTKNTFSYQSVTYPSSPNAPVSGTVQVTHGFTQLTNNGSSVGYALEVMGRFAILRPGSINAAPVLAVPQTSCYQISGRSRFQYVAVPAGTAGVQTTAPTFGYGSVVASTGSAGKSWQFENMQGNVVSGPTSFSAMCGTVGSATAINFTGQQSVLNGLWAPNPEPLTMSLTANTNSSISIGPSGFFVSDQSDPSMAQPTGASVAGVIEPASPLSTSDMTSKQYLGLAYQGATTLGLNGVPATPPLTYAVSFGQPGLVGATLLGGDFPNDDVTQTPNSDMSIILGNQDATYSGLYLNVSITVPDPAQNCANFTGYPGGVTTTSGINAQGYNNCTFSGIAIAGNPEGKYAIFVNTYNWASRLGGAPLQIYLLQQ